MLHQHRTLGKWLQFGGHPANVRDTALAALDIFLPEWQPQSVLMSQ